MQKDEQTQKYLDCFVLREILHLRKFKFPFQFFCVQFQFPFTTAMCTN